MPHHQCDETASPAPGIFSIFSFGQSAFHLATQPGPRVNPVAVGCSGGDSEDLGRLFAGQAREVTQLDQPGLDRITLGELGQRGVECEQILIRLGRGDEVGMEFPPLSSAAVDLATFFRRARSIRMRRMAVAAAAKK